MTRSRLLRGLRIFVGITLVTFGYLIYSAIASKQADLALGLRDLKPGWLVVAAIFALQEGIWGGTRLFLLGRVLWPEIKLRTAISSEFVLMFAAGVTPAQAGSVPAQVAVLMHSGMRFVHAATAELLVATCTIVFFLGSALTILVMQQTGAMELAGGSKLHALVGLSVVVFGLALTAIVLAALSPGFLKKVIALVLGRPLRRWPNLLQRILLTVDDFHAGIRLYAQRGKLAYLGAVALTFGFFCSRFAVAYFILLALGIPTEPTSFVTIGPPIVQIVLVQALLNFALYLSPTPGASGIAEAGSTWLMAPWVQGVFALPYLVLWRFLALFLSMIVGGVYVFRFLGTTALEAEINKGDTMRAALQSRDSGTRQAQD
ncbi:MAG: flippase-like domain-containing protein [Myxococcales bacterium]|nr:flippase-like domain-containing protein [Myxococcales bacterium]